MNLLTLPTKSLKLQSNLLLSICFFCFSLLLATIDTVGVSTPTVNNTLTDHLGSIQKTVDNTGNITSSTDYTPYGSERLQTGIQSSRKYIGETYDSDTGLNYLNARYYNSQQGQFISQDPVFWELGLTQVTSTLSCHLLPESWYHFYC